MVEVVPCLGEGQHNEGPKIPWKVSTLIRSLKMAIPQSGEMIEVVGQVGHPNLYTNGNQKPQHQPVE